MNLKVIVAILVLLVGFSVPSVFGHGLGGETHPPVTIGDRNAVLSIEITPSTYDPDNPEHFVTLTLFDSKNGYELIIEHVSFVFELKKDGERIFRQMFHDDFGYLNFLVISNESETIKIDGTQEPLLGGWMRSPGESLTLSGPIFSSGGLYEYKIEVVTVDSDNNVLDERVELEGAISLAETSSFNVTDSKQNIQDVTVISYFDSIENFNYEQSKISFSMPFDWNQDFEQLSVVHEEIRIPKEFSEFLQTKYDIKINEISLKENVVTIDDYSSEGRTIHIVLNREELKQIKEQAIKKSNTEMFFEVSPSKDNELTSSEQPTPKFPIKLTSSSKTKPNEASYDVDLTWIPPVLIPGEDSEFIFTIYEKDSKIPVPDAYYEFVLVQNSEEIFRKAGIAPAGGYFEDYVFSEDNAGQILLKLDRINKSDEYVEISVNVVPEFGIISLLVLGVSFVIVLIIGKKMIKNQFLIEN